MEKIETILLNIEDIISQNSLNLQQLQVLEKQFINTEFYKYEEELNELLIIIYLTFGKQFQRLQCYNEAIFHYTSCLNYSQYISQKQRNDCYQSLGIISNLQQEFKKSIEYYSQLPENPSFFFNIGLAYSKLNQPNKAIENYMLSIEKDKNFIKSYLNLGAEHLKLNHYDSALLYFLKAQQINDQDPRCYHNLGVIYMKQKKYERSILFYQKSLSLLFNEQSLYELLLTNLIQNNKEQAMQVYLSYSDKLTPQQIIKMAKLFQQKKCNKEANSIIKQGFIKFVNFKDFLEDSSVKKEVLNEMRIEKMQLMKQSLLALKNNKIYTTLFRKEINQEIIDFLPQFIHNNK